MERKLLSPVLMIVLALLAADASRGSEVMVLADIPLLCQDQGKNCGDIPDGHGGTVNCGTCSSPDTCGGSSVPNVCGCTPQTCAGHCGDFYPGCNRANLSCGGCTKPFETCGGGGMPNVCGCTPKTCGLRNCGSIDPGCGLQPVSCGQCTGTAVCTSSGVCCTPRTCAGVSCGSIDPGCGLPPLTCGAPCCTPRACRSNECGERDLGCGVKRDCGGCPDDRFCDHGFCVRIGPDPGEQCPCGGRWPNACMICTESTQTPALCVERGKNCGLIDDGHGKKVNCGTCKGKETCGGSGVPNVCGQPRKKK
jgi:hypothetical protein